MAVLADDPTLLPHLHISAQHGDDVILKRMKRRHLARDILRFCDEARRRRPDVVFGADVIAGFPTESDQAHQASLDMIEAAGITHLHVFPYSPRSGTPAAAMPQLSPEIIKARARALRQFGGTTAGRIFRFCGWQHGSAFGREAQSWPWAQFCQNSAGWGELSIGVSR